MSENSNSSNNQRQGSSRRGGRGRKRGTSQGRRRSSSTRRRKSSSDQQRQRHQKKQEQVHPLDPIHAIKVKRNATEPNRDPGHKKLYEVLFFDTVPQAMAALEEVAAKAAECTQLNIVIKAEADRQIPELTQHGKVFAGEAWTVIHQRRVQDGWYAEKQEHF